MFWLALVHFLLPSLTSAAALPQPSDVVLWYEEGDIETQGRYNYLFTVAGDETIYPCAANRCSLEPFLGQANVDLTIYKLPEGYPRVTNVIDQATLAEYRTAAEQTYQISQVSTTPANADPSGRTFQEIHLHADGSFEQNTVTQEKNALLAPQQAAATSWPRWFWPVAGGVIIAALLGGGLWLWKRRN